MELMILMMVIALELRLWLEGKIVRNPSILVSTRIEDSINRFIKFGRTPLQEDLILWILSRSELYCSPSIHKAELVFGGLHQIDENEYMSKLVEMDEQYPKNVTAAVRRSRNTDNLHNIEGSRIDNLITGDS